MSWERRRRQHYFYTARKVDGRVVKEYQGRGEQAVLAAELDTRQQAERRAQAEAWRVERERLESLDALAARFRTMIHLLVETALVGGGFHKHGGVWRKRRGRSHQG